MQKGFGKYSDIELFHALKSNQKNAEGAFAELYSRYSQRVYAYCLRATGSPDDARDIFQETFLKFYSSSQKEGDPQNIPAYLLMIARNQCINYKRKMKVTYDIDEYNFFTNDTGYEQKELLQLLSRALECLEFEYREAFILRQYQGLSYEEIAEITGDSVSAIKNRVWRAKEKVKDILEPYLHDLTKY